MVGIALLGAGIFATEQHLPSLRRLGGDLRAVYSRSQTSAKKLLTVAEQLGYSPTSIDLYSDDTAGKGLDELLRRGDISAVIIVLPIPVQPDVCRKALAAGKHVLVEKPLAKDVKTAKELVIEYQREYLPKGLVFSVAEQFRYFASHELARKWVVEDKLIGDLVQVHLRLWRNLPPDQKYLQTSWRKVPEYQGGFVLDGGVHHVALLRYVSGQEIIETRGFAHQFSAHMPPADTVNSAILFSGGAVGTFSICFASSKLAHEVNFVGTKGSLTISATESKVTVLDHDQKVVKEEVAASNGVDNEIEAFLKAIEGGKNEDRAGVKEALNDVAVVESLVSGGGKVQNWQS